MSHIYDEYIQVEMHFAWTPYLNDSLKILTFTYLYNNTYSSRFKFISTIISNIYLYETAMFMMLDIKFQIPFFIIFF